MWAWLLTLTGITGMFLIARKNPTGWLVLILSEALWTWYAVATDQLGFVLGALVYGYVAVVGYARWVRDEAL